MWRANKYSSQYPWVLRGSLEEKRASLCIALDHFGEIISMKKVSSIGSMMYNTAKFLAKILRPLVGPNDHHIINSEDFISKIADREELRGRNSCHTMFRRCLRVSRSTKLCQLLDRNWNVTQLYQVDVL